METKAVLGLGQSYEPRNLPDAIHYHSISQESPQNQADMSEYTVYRGVEGTMKPCSVPKPKLGPEDILVRITHTGVCTTDLLHDAALRSL